MTALSDQLADALHEDAMADREARGVALEAWTELQSRVEAGEAQPAPRQQGFLVQLRSHPLLVLLVPKGAHAGMGTMGGRSVLQLPVLNGPSDPEHMQTRLSSLRATFVHEVDRVGGLLEERVELARALEVRLGRVERGAGHAAVRPILHPDMLKHLGPKYLRKLQSRMHGFYEQLRADLGMDSR
jgi:hypothetical protein